MGFYIYEVIWKENLSHFTIAAQKLDFSRLSDEFLSENRSIKLELSLKQLTK